MVSRVIQSGEITKLPDYNQGDHVCCVNTLTQSSRRPQKVGVLSSPIYTGWLSYLGGPLGLSKYSVRVTCPRLTPFSCCVFIVLPYRRHIESISQLEQEEKEALSDILSHITRRYDNLFSCSFAYSMGIHQRPVPAKGDDDQDHENNFAHLHLHFDPPLLRSATVKKFLVGCVHCRLSPIVRLLIVMSPSYEMMAESQRDLTPERAAEQLRQCSETHYLESTNVQ